MTTTMPHTEDPVIDGSKTPDEILDEHKPSSDGEGMTPPRLDKHGLLLSPQPTTLKSDPLVCRNMPEHCREMTCN
jgi:hypothetical protein